MKFRPILAAPVALALGLAACNSGAEPSDTAATDPALADPAVTPTETATSLASSPQEFVNMAASSDMYETEAAKLAQQNGTAKGVKDFAAMMLKDHGASTAKLKAAAQTMSLIVPASMMPQHEALLSELRSAEDNFDAVYARQQVAAHEQALALMRGYSGAGGTGGGQAAASTPGVAPSASVDAAANATGGGDALATFASETAPIIEGHLTQARALPGS